MWAASFVLIPTVIRATAQMQKTVTPSLTPGMTGVTKVGVTRGGE